MRAAKKPKAAKPPMISEKAFQDTVTAALELYGWLWYHTHDSRRCNKGFPDIIAVRGQTMLALELKREDGKATMEQYMWLDALKGTGARCFVLRPSNWDTLLSIISKKRGTE